MVRVGARALELNAGEGIKIALKALGSPGMVYRNIARANGKFSRSHRMRLLEAGGDHVRLRFVDLVRRRATTRSTVSTTVGSSRASRRCSASSPAEVRHRECAASGAEIACTTCAWDAGRQPRPLRAGDGHREPGRRRGQRRRAAELLPLAGLAALGVWLAGSVARPRRLPPPLRAAARRDPRPGAGDRASLPLARGSRVRAALRRAAGQGDVQRPHGGRRAGVRAAARRRRRAALPELLGADGREARRAGTVGAGVAGAAR